MAAPLAQAIKQLLRARHRRAGDSRRPSGVVSKSLCKGRIETQVDVFDSSSDDCLALSILEMSAPSI
jgi:hypothetical protein